jgi:hypothetical protein
VKYQVEVENVVYYCFYADMTAVAGTYLVKFTGVVNGKDYAGDMNLYISTK